MQKDANTTFSSLKVDGGASNNDLLMQIQADLLNTTVVRPKTTETTALGAAFFAGLATGFWSSMEELKKSWEVDAEFKPQADAGLQKIIANWEHCVGNVLTDN